MADPLQVKLSGEFVGELHENGAFFWNEDSLPGVPLNAQVLSHSLPFRGEARDPGAFFGGLLPEGIGLERLARESRVATNDLFGLLAEVGADVGGSVTIGEPHPPREPLLIDEQEYDQVLQRAYGYLRGTAVGGGGSSVTGVQRKVALTWDPNSERWLIGRGSTPSTHILKPVGQENAESLYAESYLNGIARLLGLAHHAAWVEPAGQQAVLIVERYDRVRANDGTLSRLHQEDAAQALGLPWGANDKYESVNPQANLRAIARLLDRGRSVFSAEPSDQERLLSLVTLNVVAGNTDAHAKNFSLMLPSIRERSSQGWVARLADAYDLVPQSLLSVEQSPFAMRIGGTAQPNDVTAGHICAEGEGWGMQRSRAEQVVADTLAALAAAVAQSEPARNVEKLSPYLDTRIKNLQRGDRVWTRSSPPALS